MFKIYSSKNRTIFLPLLTLIVLILIGIYFCIINNYGWDWDTYAMIESYLNILEDGRYVRSRGAGYLVPEIGIGFLSYYLGSFSVNFLSFSFLIIGIIFIYKSLIKNLEKYISFDNKKHNQTLIIFLLICLTNHVVFKDSTIPMDYSWSFLFYSMGFFFITRKQIELSLIFFSLSFGSRFNFIVFILPTILFVNQSFINNKKKLFATLVIMTFGGLFYLPSWLQSSFSLSFIFSSNWYNSFKSAPVLSLEEFVRFSHKVISALGLLFSIIIFCVFFFNRKKFSIIFKNYKIPIILALINLIVFFFFPWEPSFLWMLIFVLNFILVTFCDKKILYLLIFINLFTWFCQVKIIEVNYMNEGCLKHPIQAKLKINFEKGFILTFPERKEHTKCYPDLLGNNTKIIKYKLQFINGSRLSS
jgi:hypothetical protein